MARKVPKEQYALDAGLRMLSASLKRLRRSVRYQFALSRPAERRAVAVYAIDILEAAFLIAPSETGKEYGKWVAQMVAEVNGFCAGCGKVCEAGLCKECELKDHTDFSGDIGTAAKN